MRNNFAAMNTTVRLFAPSSAGSGVFMASMSESEIRVFYGVHELDLAAVPAERFFHAMLAGVLVAFFRDDVATHAAAVRPESIVGAPEHQVLLFLGQLDVEIQLGLCVQSLVFVDFAFVDFALIVIKWHGCC